MELLFSIIPVIASVLPEILRKLLDIVFNDILKHVSLNIYIAFLLMLNCITLLLENL